MKILIVSGFLGAGKTTMIQALAKATKRDFVVYENEYAGAGIDTERLEKEAKLNVYESIENCVCCSGKADFAASILTISCSLDPEYLIVEPTGLARLSNILANIRQILYGNLTLLHPLVVVDAISHAHHKLTSPDIYWDQIKSASTILISKTKSVLPEELAILKRELSEANPAAELITDTSVDEAWFWRLLRLELDQPESAAYTEPQQDEPMERMALSNVSFASPVHLIAFLNALVWGQCGSVFRAKGCLPCGNLWLQFDLVDQTWQISGAKAQERAECILIGNTILRNAVRKHMIEELIVQLPIRKRMRKNADLHHEKRIKPTSRYT